MKKQQELEKSNADLASLLVLTQERSKKTDEAYRILLRTRMGGAQDPANEAQKMAQLLEAVMKDKDQLREDLQRVTKLLRKTEEEAAKRTQDVPIHTSRETQTRSPTPPPLEQHHSPLRETGLDPPAEASSTKPSTSYSRQWDEQGNVIEDEEPEDEEWEFQRDMFAELSLTVRMLTHYEAVIRKLGRLLYPNRLPTSHVELSGPLLKMKMQAIWEQWELDHPETVRGGYTVDPKKPRSREVFENQPQWRKEWFKIVEGSLKIYVESSQHLRIDPSSRGVHLKKC